MLHARPDYNGRIIDKAGIIPADEPVFLLRGQDAIAPFIVAQWAVVLEFNRGDPLMVEMAKRHAHSMMEWQRTHTKKQPDLPQENKNKSGDIVKRICTAADLARAEEILQTAMDEAFERGRRSVLPEAP